MVEEQQQETTQTTLLPQMLAHIVACVQAKRGAILRHEQGQWLLRASHTAVGKAIDITGFNLLLHEMMHTTDVKEVAHCVITSDPVLGEHTLCVLLVQHGRVSGALYLEKNAGDAPFNTAERNQTQQLAVWVMSQLENESLRFQVQETVHHLQRLREEEFVATKQRFLTNISHELRTPLNAIIGYAELVRDNLQALSQPQLVADLQRIEHSAWHLLDLINDLLNMARIERGDVAVHTTTFDLLDVTKEETEKFRAFAKQNNSQITLEAPAEMTNISTDKCKIKYILFSLLSNACKFTYAGQITVTMVQYQNGVEIAVKDTSIGMTPAQLRTIFSPFTQGDNSKTRPYSGTGLGLAIARHYCRQLKGWMTVQSEHGRGSIFTVFLPLDRLPD